MACTGADHDHATAVLLDVDGTLLDSNGAHARAWIEALTAVGIHVSIERILWMIGMGGDKILPELGVEPDSARARMISAQRRHAFLTRHLPACRPQPGACALLRRLGEDGLRRIVATSAHRDELAPLLERAGVADCIDGAATSGDAARSKPDPDIVCAALARARVPATAAVFIGDTPYDVESGQRAGVTVLALRCGGWDDASLTGAAAIYDSPADLLARYADSPLAWHIAGPRRWRPHAGA